MSMLICTCEFNVIGVNLKPEKRSAITANLSEGCNSYIKVCQGTSNYVPINAMSKTSYKCYATLINVDLGVTLPLTSVNKIFTNQKLELQDKL